MKTYIDNLQHLFLGREDDGGVTVVEIDCSSWKKEYPQLTDYRLEVTSPAGVVYFPIVSMNGDMLTWDITQNDTAVNGSGRYQVVATGTDGIKKTSHNAEIIVMSVMPGTASDTPPDPAKRWTDDVFDAARRAEEAAQRAENAENFPGGGNVSEDVIKKIVEGELEEAKESGEFDGKDGQDGRDGSDGVSVTHEWNGTTLTVTSASGTSSADLKGEPGKDGYTPQKGIDYFDGRDGERGEPGKDGYTPQKGIDYFDGKDGQDGRDGSDGVSVTHEWNGTTLTVTSASGTSSADLKGEPGKDGYTPKKGIDYYTESDMNEIDEHIKSALNAKEPADYVVEAGTDGIWTYEKWNSGKAICNGTLKEKKTNYTTISGFNGYYSSNAYYPKNLFVSPPIMMHSSKVGNGFVIDGGDVQNSADHAAAYALCTASGEVNCVWNFYCVGRWK